MLETCNSNLTSCFYGFAVPRLQQIHKSRQTTGACYDFYFFPSTLKTTREESKMSNFHTTLFQNSFVLVS